MDYVLFARPSPDTVCTYIAVKSEAEASASIDDVLKSIEPDYRPTTRSATAKRKRSPSPVPTPAGPPKFSLTPIDSLFLDGMGPEQIWEQLELRTKNVSEACCD